MPIEGATYIDDLVVTNPTGADDYATADDHLRLIKDVLKSQFTSLGQAAVSATASELNKLDGFTGLVADFNILSGGAAAGVTAAEFAFLAGVTSDIQTQLDAKVPDAREVISGAGLTGGGSLAANRTLAVGAGTGIVVNADDVAVDPNNSRNTDHTSVSVIAGSGLTGGGTIAQTRTINVGAGAGLAASADEIQLDTTSTRNRDHATISLLAGAGLTGGGTIDANRTVTAGAGLGITVNANDIALNTAHARNVDHSAISITAGTGLSGGGTINNSRTLNLDVDSLVDDSVVPSRTSTVPIYNGSVMRKSTMEDIRRLAERTTTVDTTLVADDAGRVVRGTSANARNITIPPNSEVPFPLWTVVGGERYGAGALTWVAGAGVTIRSPGGLKAHRVQYSPTYVRKIGTNEWMLGGDLG